ncbi:hypothetical protein N7466_004519 [Penicillium verhagenii]|uniref:uncharacterized protein n=1 Tax=Penicillium verhagenii TaxID=1562060 RepID=UPI0025454D7E|nr:uncharacterized protein N7466_004519 [Penicillium verhagenii]KAJ5934972.1 hypothetical protein N7466_004519 [Penicillium verhagenii]
MSITSLPSELLTRICDFLEPGEWGKFRGTCHQIFANTLEAYTSRYFKKISIILTREGLKHLEGIAGSEVLRGSVKEVWIIPNLFEGYSKVDKAKLIEVDPEDYRSTLGQLPTEEEMYQFGCMLEFVYGLYKAQIREHILNLQGSGLSKTLEKCLPCLENLTSVGVQSFDTSLLLSVPIDFSCLGLRKFKSTFCGVRNYRDWPVCHPRHQDFSILHALTFSHLLKAIVKSGRKVQALHTCANQTCGMKLKFFELSKSDYERLLPLLSDLVTLHLSIRLADYKFEVFNEATFKYLLKILARVASTLKTLTFAQWSPSEELSAHYFQNLSQSIQFSQLKELSLYSIEVRTETLRVFLRTAAPTLRRLSMNLVSLTDPITAAPDLEVMSGDPGTWYTSLSIEVKNEIKGLWERVFQSWADQLDLHFVRLSDLGYRGRDIRLIDPLRLQHGQRDSRLSSLVRSLCFDTQKTSITFKQWVTQLRVEMWHRPGFGNPRLPATSRINFSGLRH